LRSVKQEKEILQNQIHREREIKNDFEKRYKESSEFSSILEMKLEDANRRESILKRKNQELTQFHETTKLERMSIDGLSTDKIREYEERTEQLINEKVELRDLYMDCKEKYVQRELECKVKRRNTNEGTETASVYRK